MASDKAAAREEQLLREFTLYDEHVDIVSCFEWIFTDSKVKGLPGTVSHFERFPRVVGRSGGRLTPDFTVLFNDSSAIIGEIARIANHESSVDSLCSQLMNYDGVEAVPGETGSTVEVAAVSIMQLVPFKLGPTAVKRIIRDRYNDDSHSYKPARKPVVIQHARNESNYVFQRVSDSDNGELIPSQRVPDIREYLDSSLEIKADNFKRVKTDRVFMNDPIPPLYLATHLWLKTIPSYFGGGAAQIRTSPEELAAILRDQYGHVRVQDIKKAFELLVAARLGSEKRDGTWNIARTQIGRSGEREIQKVIAARATKGVDDDVQAPTRRRRPGASRQSPGQGSLF